VLSTHQRASSHSQKAELPSLTNGIATRCPADASTTGDLGNRAITDTLAAELVTDDPKDRQFPVSKMMMEVRGQRAGPGKPTAAHEVSRAILRPLARFLLWEDGMQALGPNAC